MKRISKPLKDLEYLKLNERNKIFSFNNTKVSYPQGITLIDQFEEQVEKNPEQLAVICGDEKISYRKLDNQANWIASQLVEAGVGESQKVALLFYPSIEMIASIIAILKLRAVYVPLSTQFPLERVKFILSHCEASLLLTHSMVQDEIISQDSSELDTKYLSIDTKLYPGGVYASPQRISDPQELLYIIYTSGSTGKPKGVEVKEKGVLNTIWAGKELFGFDKNTKGALIANIGFDAAAFEIWTCVTSGSCLHIAPQEVRLDAEAMYEWLINQSIEVTFQVPAIAESLLKKNWDQATNRLRFMIIGGDKLNYFPNVELPFKTYNGYGPTEDSIFSTFAELSHDADRSYYTIGKPIPNKQIYILDKNKNLQPIGVPGELCISGVGLAKGYVSNNALTKEKFVENPFVEGERIYKTGDLARWHSNGEIEFLGRIDNQVKLRGYRIELGEIEKQMLSHELIEHAIVLLKRKEENTYLAAYYTSSEGLASSDLRSYLSNFLPDYMLPGYYVEMEEMPLNLNGKLDRRALPDPEIQVNDSYVTPRNEVEDILSRVWAEVLGVERVGITDNFFLLGGDSIKSIQVRSRLQNTGYDVSVRDIFKYQTIEKLSEVVEEPKRHADQSEVKGEVPLTGIQHHLLSRPQFTKQYYNQSVLLNFPKRISTEEVQKIFTHLQQHHDALRMVFHSEGNSIRQYNSGIDHPISLDYQDLRSPLLSGLLESYCNELRSSINLDTGPLMKLGLFDIEEGSYLLIVIHHLVVDRFSWDILFEDLETLYKQVNSGLSLSLPPKTDSLKYWSEGIADYMKGREYQISKNYWESQRFQEGLEILPINSLGSHKRRYGRGRL